MKQVSLILILCVFAFSSNAQRIAKVTLNAAGGTEMISIGLDDAIINVSLTGNIINYGVEYFSEKISNYSRIENYNGRLEIYTTTDDKAFQGKVKYIGRTPVTYYASYDIEALQGKIKSIGNLTFNYYMPYDEESAKGKIKSIGSNNVTFYTSYDNEALRGKLKSIGNTNLNYYSSFEDSAFRGKIKSIGQVSFTYYASFDRQFAGAMKTGTQRQNVNGINFVVN